MHGMHVCVEYSILYDRSRHRALQFHGFLFKIGLQYDAMHCLLCGG